MIQAWGCITGNDNTFSEFLWAHDKTQTDQPPDPITYGDGIYNLIVLADVNLVFEMFYLLCNALITYWSIADFFPSGRGDLGFTSGYSSLAAFSEGLIRPLVAMAFAGSKFTDGVDDGLFQLCIRPATQLMMWVFLYQAKSLTSSTNVCDLLLVHGEAGRQEDFKHKYKTAKRHSDVHKSGARYHLLPQEAPRQTLSLSLKPMPPTSLSLEPMPPPSHNLLPGMSPRGSTLSSHTLLPGLPPTSQTLPIQPSLAYTSQAAAMLQPPGHPALSPLALRHLSGQYRSPPPQQSFLLP
eukprot:Blabericola_migrator_1__4366@NODE_2347_length_2905_cov_90_316772_g1468_i0_p1_GENE_NODE_2347_length_2905_cov_90_316772_g1468_i0NODE_2347_length_2905_cov_90_316772_g1468_i0_p1_ORF_typecomplete_len295_score38_40_NODE_2347_length_2905_cov_90_316772_g1468_i03831267